MLTLNTTCKPDNRSPEKREFFNFLFCRLVVTCCNARLNASHLSDSKKGRGGVSCFNFFKTRNNGIIIEITEFINQRTVRRCLSARIITNGARLPCELVAGYENNKKTSQLRIPQFSNNRRTEQQLQKETQPLNTTVKRRTEKLNVPGHINAEPHITGNTTLAGHKYYSLSESSRLLSSGADSIIWWNSRSLSELLSTR
ncbi:hypothetical protein GQN26_19050 [Escherichia coli]|uniref:hypothetical protein n=1 Tax=Escherichia coli TaxID=562 RepID=UPI00131137AA|nr:hypothetical protein [Escherichia coli]EEY8548192.1 hypothetical protein [Escherichia coli]MEB5810535.1 hypothetical protein [Escherichia coli]MWO32808.1 hypothetical protein [Escherichia coli]MWP59161.1 hypothetical protein [Escherichia coli]MXF54921.1 hypothetical protein [Escherichia coli]